MFITHLKPLQPKTAITDALADPCVFNNNHPFDYNTKTSRGAPANHDACSSDLERVLRMPPPAVSEHRDSHEWSMNSSVRLWRAGHIHAQSMSEGESLSQTLKHLLQLAQQQRDQFTTTVLQVSRSESALKDSSHLRVQGMAHEIKQILAQASEARSIVEEHMDALSLQATGKQQANTVSCVACVHEREAQELRLRLAAAQEDVRNAEIRASKVSRDQKDDLVKD
jgi:hypothetical protein